LISWICYCFPSNGSKSCNVYSLKLLLTCNNKSISYDTYRIIYSVIPFQYYILIQSNHSMRAKHLQESHAFYLLRLLYVSCVYYNHSINVVKCITTWCKKCEKQFFFSTSKALDVKIVVFILFTNQRRVFTSRSQLIGGASDRSQK
jgi:hypothetical protein